MLKNFTLLYVEDNQETRELIEEILENRVKEIYTAVDGKDGLEVYKDKRPDIILTDINMPNLNGIDMAKEIKKLNSAQPILILTAFNENHLLHDSVDIGVDGYITKPIVDIEKLIAPLTKTAQRLQGYIDKKKLENLLEIQGKTAAVGEMIGNIAHQWRQPLSIITTLVTTMEVDIDFGEDISKEQIIKCAQDVNKQAQYLSKTIDDFRDFLRADISKKESINLKRVIEKTEDLVVSSLKDNYIKYTKELEDITIMGNENQLIQAILNIFNNAKDALKQIEDNNRYLFISTKVENNKAVILIKDSGGGIKEDITDRIFEPYFTTKHKSVGTGIGLYITYNTIKKVFNGNIEASNVEYEYDGKKLKGAQFTIILPYKLS